MTKKKTKIILITGISVVALATASVLVYNKFIKKDADISDFATVALSEIVADTKIPDKEYTNLDFSQAVLNMPDAEKLYQYYGYDDEKLTKEQCTQYCYDLFDMFIKPMCPEGEDIVYTDIETNPLPEGEAEYIYTTMGDFTEARLHYGFDEDYYEYAGEKIALYGVSCSSGGSIYVDASDKSHGTEYEKIIRFDRGDELADETYVLNGEEYSTAQAMQFANETLEKLSPYLENATLAPTEFVILKNTDNDDYQYEIQFEYVLENIPAFHLAPPDDSSQDRALSIINHILYMTIDSPDHISYFFSGFPLGDKTAMGDELKDKYIPLDKAIDLASDYLAPYYMNIIDEVTIKYVDMYWYTPGASLSDEVKKTPMAPCWCFIWDTGDKNDLAFTRKCNAIFVDMQTGEVIVYDPVYGGYKSSVDSTLESEKLL